MFFLLISHRKKPIRFRFYFESCNKKIEIKPFLNENRTNVLENIDIDTNFDAEFNGNIRILRNLLLTILQAFENSSKLNRTPNKVKQYIDYFL